MGPEQTPEQRAERDAILSPHRRMVKFIEQCGGSARFDVFANEHLTGSGGFYSDHINLSQVHSPVPTPMDMRPAYRAAYALKVLDAVDTVYKRTGKSEITVCEIGPGGGELHQEVIAQFNQAKERFANIDKLRYIAVDPNPRHVQNIINHGGIGLRGRAEALPISDERVDVFVAEEVLDSLPYRIISIDRNGRPDKEAFVRLNGNQMELVFLPLEGIGDELAILTSIARATFAENPNAKYFRFSDQYLEFWQECYRVTSPEGIALVSDYTTSNFMTRFIENDLGHEEQAIRAPYQRDLTHMVNFTIQEALAIYPGFKPSRDIVQINDDSEILHQLVSGREVIVADKSQDAYSPTDLKRLYDGTPGAQSVIAMLLKRPPTDGKDVVDFLKRNNLSGGALWIIYSDIANRDLDRFMKVIRNCTPKEMEWIKLYE